MAPPNEEDDPAEDLLQEYFSEAHVKHMNDIAEEKNT